MQQIHLGMWLDELGEGHCFDQLFAGEALQEAQKLSAITSCASLRRIANRHAKPYSLGSFGLVAGSLRGVPVWHVQPGNLSAEDCLHMMDKASLVGANALRSGQGAQDVSTEVHAVGPVVNAPAASFDTSGPVLKRRFNWSLTLTISAGETDYAVVNPTTIPRIINVAKLFESVKLVGCGAVLSVSPHVDVIAGIAFGTQGFGPADMGALRARPHNMLCYGRSDGWHRHYWDLPNITNFGRDYKMVNPGNKVGHLAVKLAGPNLAQVDVDGYFDIEFSGEGVVDPIRLKSPSYSGARFGGQRVGHNLRPDSSEGESESDEEDVVADSQSFGGFRSPAESNAGGKRAIPSRA